LSVDARRSGYQEIADDLRRKISAGVYPVDSALPSTTQLMGEYSVSSTVIQRAVRELKHEGIAIGQPGKAVYVSQEPKPATPSAEYAEVMRQIAALRETFETTAASLNDRLSALENAVRQPRPRAKGR
jgi:DNA-binding GntR family transcriptional regulator